MPGDVSAAEGEVMFLGQKVIYLERILTGIRESWLGPDPVRWTLPESGRWQRVGIEQRTAVGTEPFLWNDVQSLRVGSGRARQVTETSALVINARRRIRRGWFASCGSRYGDERIPGEGAAAQELIGRIEQLTQVAIAHRHSGYRPGGSILLPPINPLFGHEEEELAPIRVELAGDEDGAAHIEAELVEAECRWGGRDSRIIALIARPGVGVERRIAEVFNQVAVEVARATLGDEANLAPGRAPIFGGVIGRQDLHFLDRIHVLRAEH